MVLDAGTGIGNGAPLNLTAARVRADTDLNAISIASQNGPPGMADLLNVTGASPTPGAAR